MGYDYEQTFPLADSYRQLSAEVDEKTKAIATGEKRCPKAGEWFLSGAVVEAHRTENDLTTEYHIARLVKVKVFKVEKIVRFI